MAGLWDTHCHLDLEQFDADREAVLERAAAAGVVTIVDPAIDLSSCRRVLALADRFPIIHAAVGVHPNESAGFDERSVDALREMAQHPKVVAIGEIGLDYYRDRVPQRLQKQALRAQLALAAELGLPVILHCRAGRQAGGCLRDLLAEMAEWGPEIRQRRGDEEIVGVWHAFSGAADDALQAYDLGLALGLGGPVTYRNAGALRAVAPHLRVDRLLLETDAPFLAPHPHRGERNEPAHVRIVADELARLLGVSPDLLAALTGETAGRCFRIDARVREGRRGEAL